MAGFNPKQYMTKLQGKDYLEVKWRVVWFREQHPGGAISTELVATEPTVIVRAQITSADGAILAADYGTAPAAGKGTWTGRAVEKASTAAVGRALALAGFGTQFDADDDTDNLADSPVERPRAGSPASSAPVAPAPSSAPPSGNGAQPVNGWTPEIAAEVSAYARELGFSVPESLRVLAVKGLSQFEAGPDMARKMLQAAAEKQAAQS